MKNLFSFFILLTCYSFCSGKSITAPTILSSSLWLDTISDPIRNLSVTIKDNAKGLLRWKCTAVPGESFFAVEKSNNGTDFNVVGVIKNTNSGWIEFLDDAPSKGKIYYRVKFTCASSITYSEIISATLSIDASCKFYPNPVDKVLIVRSESTVELQITDKFGKALIIDRLPVGLNVIDVSTLGAGIYVITLFQKETNRLITEKLVKK